MKIFVDRAVDEFLLVTMQVHTFIMCYVQIPEFFTDEAEYDEVMEAVQ